MHIIQIDYIQTNYQKLLNFRYFINIMENVLLNVLVKRWMKLEQIEVVQNVQKLFIHVTSL